MVSNGRIPVSRRDVVRGAAGLGLVAPIAFAATAVHAQDATPVSDYSSHPAVGAWTLDGYWHNILHPNGSVTAISVGHGAGIGVWEPTGPASGRLVVVYDDMDESETAVEAGWMTARVTFSVSGDELIASGFFGLQRLDGSVAGEQTGGGTFKRMTVASLWERPVPPAGTPSG